MGYGDIIKRAWRITWRYRALWVLGLFAGVAGSSSGGGSGGNNRSSGSGSDFGAFSRAMRPERWAEQLGRVLPVLIAGALILFALCIVLWILHVAARGGLVHAVNEIEEGRPFTLGAAWSAGFGRFWRLLGLSIVLGLPLAVVGLGLGLAVAVPILLPLMRGEAPGPESFVPLCGAFAIGVPLLLVGGVILGIMQELGLRSIMLDDMGVFDAASAGWRSFRTRIKDTLIMWFVNFGLNLLAGIVIAIPIVVIILAAIVPVGFSAYGGAFGPVIAISVVAVFIVTLVLMVYTAIWGTFTSALWTVFFRRLTGRELLAEMPAAYAAVPEPPAAPAAPEGASL